MRIKFDSMIDNTVYGGVYVFVVSLFVLIKFVNKVSNRGDECDEIVYIAGIL